jgi:hypothetical protein
MRIFGKKKSKYFFPALKCMIEGEKGASLFLVTHPKKLQLGLLAEVGNKQVMITKRNIR